MATITNQAKKHPIALKEDQPDFTPNKKHKKTPSTLRSVPEPALDADPDVAITRSDEQGANLEHIQSLDDDDEEMPKSTKDGNDVEGMSEDEVKNCSQDSDESVEGTRGEMNSKLDLIPDTSIDEAKKSSTYIPPGVQLHVIYEEMVFPVYGFYMRSPYKFKHKEQLEVRRMMNNKKYKLGRRLNPIPFVTNQPEGMPRWIKSVDDIVDMSEDEVRTFLRGYDQIIYGSVERMKRDLAITIGMPYDDANEKFKDTSPKMLSNYTPPAGQLNVNYEEMVFPAYDFYMKSPYKFKHKEQLEVRRMMNNKKYKLGRRLNPIPFVTNQPEGMPRWIKSVDDIVDMSEDEVRTFLRGYDQIIYGSVERMKRDLVITVGVSFDDADEKFNVQA